MIISLCLLPLIVLAQETQVRTFDVHSADPEFLVSVLEDIKSIQGKVFYDANTLQLVIIDTPESLDKIAEMLEKLDPETRMVNIAVTIVEASDEFLSDMGIRSGQIVIPGTRFQALLSAIENSSDSYVKSRTNVSTISNSPACIQLTEDFIIGYEQNIHQQSGSRTITPIRESIGQILEVLPKVRSDNSVLLSIQPSRSTIEGNTPYKRSISTQVNIEDGDTLVLGGLNTEHSSVESDSSFFGLPLASRQTERGGRMVMFLTVDVKK